MFDVLVSLENWRWEREFSPSLVGCEVGDGGEGQEVCGDEFVVIRLGVLGGGVLRWRRREGRFGSMPERIVEVVGGDKTAKISFGGKIKAAE